jgi:predicted nucleotidyltransferase component of viral defense system
MDAFLRMSDSERRLTCEQAQAVLGLPPAAVEKDFWVCWTLQRLFNLPDWGGRLTFKGGTSLAKAWRLIERFSEDIDMVIDRDFLGFGGPESPEKAPSKKKQRQRLENLKETCRERIGFGLKPLLEQSFREVLPAGSQWSLNIASVEEDPDRQTLLFKYPETLTGGSRYLRPVVKIELGARSDTWPAESSRIQPYLADAFPDLLGPSDFTVRVVASERTFWEKVMLLHEETFRPTQKPRKARLSRHYYDLWCLIRKGVADRAMQNSLLFAGVVEHRSVFFSQNWMDYNTLRQGSLRLIPLDAHMAEWRQDYQVMRGEMFFGEAPDFDEILRVVADFERKFNQGGPS